MSSMTTKAGALFQWCKTRHAKVTIFYCYSFFLLGCTIAAVGPALKEIARRCGQNIDDGTIGLLVTSRSFGYLGASFIGGFLLDWRPVLGNWLIVFGLLCNGVATVVMTQVFNFVLMCLLMAFTGFCSGQLDVCANVLMIKEFDSAAQSEAYIMALHASFAVGAAVSPVFVTELMLRSSDKISFNIPFFCIAGLFLPAVLVGAFYIARLPVRSQTEASSESYSNQSISNVKRWVLVGLFSLVMCLYVGSEVAFGLYIFTYATEKPDPWEKDVSGLLNTMFWSAFAAGRILSIPLSLKVSAKVMVIASVIGACIFSGMPFFLRNDVVLWVCCIGLGLSMAPTFPAVYNLTGNYMNVTGRISALFVISSAFGEMVLPYLIGKLFHVSWASYVSLFPVVAISSFIGLLSLAVALLLTRNISVASHSQSHLVLSSGSEREATESDFERKLDEFGGLEDGLSDFDLL